MNELMGSEQFEGIRKVWDEGTSKWWFAVVDVIQILTDSADASAYWRQMKRRDKELVTNCHKFPIKNLKNNRTYATDCANQEGMLRIIQSVPSSKAEPFKQWLAMTGSRRLDEIRQNPIELEREKYRLQGYDEEWINARLSSIAVRNELTDEWKNRSIEGRQYAILTNETHKGTFDGMSVAQHKDLKGVKKGNLRDHMNPKELAFTILGETTAVDEIREQDAQGFGENLEAARKAGEVGGKLRKDYEELTGRKVISDKSYIENRKHLLAKGREKSTVIGACDECAKSLTETEMFGTEAGVLCSDCFKDAVARGEINEDGEVL